MSGFHRLTIVLMLVWILLVVVHPAVDLPQTVLRTGQLFPLVLVIWSAVVTAAVIDILWSRCMGRWNLMCRRFSPGCSLLEKTCVQRC